MKILICLLFSHLFLIYAQSGKCNDITCGIDTGITFFPNNTNCVCGDGDMNGHFTNCINNKKDLYFFWRPPAICHGKSLPSPVKGLSCDLTCDFGEYFNTTTIACEKCSAGKMSTPDIEYNKWDEWPGPFRRKCKAYSWQPCQEWQLKGSYIDSGANSDDTVTTLTYSVSMRQYGNLTFEYQVDAEPYYDRFNFYIDSVEKFRKSTQLTWKKVSYVLAPGAHVLEWKFTKDFVTTVGEDKAKLRNIKITNVYDVALTCDDCPPGSYSEIGSSNCTLCPAGTYNPIAGASNCVDCPPLEDSFPGAIKCHVKAPACNSHDYYPTYTSCESNQRYKIYQWIEPILCNKTHESSVQLPNNETVGCIDSCLPGYELQNTQCIACGDGMYNKDGKKCITCNSGKFLSLKREYITKFEYPLKSGWKTGCSGDCSSQGWRMIGDHSDSGYGNGISNSWLEIPIEINSIINSTLKPDIHVHYELSCLQSSGFLQFWIDGKIIKNKFCSGCNSNSEVEIFDLTMGKHTLKIDYVSGLLHDPHFTCNRAVLKNITVHGSPIGGSDDCFNCKAGTISSNGAYYCDGCFPGTYPNNNQSKCDECEIDTYSNVGFPKCESCGVGMKAPKGSAFCSWPEGSGQFSFKNKKYDLLHLINQLKANKIGTPFSNEKFGFNLDASENAACPKGSYGCIFDPKTGDLATSAEKMSISYDEKFSSLQFELTNFKGKDAINVMFINLYCDEKSVSFDPSNDIGIFSFIPKEYVVEIYSAFACKKCTDNDFELVKGQCENGIRHDTWRKTADIWYESCAFGVEKNSTTESCPIGYQFPIIWVIIASTLFVFVIVLLVSVIIIILVRHKKLQNEFHSLVENQDLGHEKL
eukprot:gene1374-11995_t